MQEYLLNCAMSLAGSIEDFSKKGLLYLEMASLYLKINRKRKCLRLLAKVLEIDESGKIDDDRPAILAAVAGLYLSAQHCKQAKNIFLKSLELAKSLKGSRKEIKGIL